MFVGVWVKGVMHLSSLLNMERFRDKYLKHFEGKRLDIVDLGSTEKMGPLLPILINLVGIISV